MTINKFGERLFMPNLHFKITHMTSYYYVSLRQCSGEQKQLYNYENSLKKFRSALLISFNTVVWSFSKQMLPARKLTGKSKFPLYYDIPRSI